MKTRNRKTKICNTCGKRKSTSEFQVKTSSKDGLRYDCKPCRTFKMRNYRATGSTNVSEHSGKSKESLDVLINQLRDAYKKLGYRIKVEKVCKNGK